MADRPTFDLYAVLGVARNATDAEIRAAYRDLVARYHPDKHQGNPLEGLAAEKVAEINRAYAILSDRELRAEYDRGGPSFRAYSTSADAARSAASGRRARFVLKTLALVMLASLLLCFGRMLIGALRLLFEGMGGLRGTPFAAGLVLLVVIVLVVALLRRRSLHKSGRPR